jgi:lysophospholipase L1-like esterase
MAIPENLLAKSGLILFGGLLALLLLELGLRGAGWAFIQIRAAPALEPDTGSSVVRVLCVGESTTANMDLMGEQSYPRQLERILNQRSHETRYRVVNGGVPGTTTTHIVDALDAQLDRVDPDLVVAMMGINDRGTIAPTLQVNDGLRVVKLARTLYFALAPLSAEGDESEGFQPAGAATHRLMKHTRASQLVIDGHYAEAEALLLPLVGSERPRLHVPTLYAAGTLAVLEWQRERDAEAGRYHDRYLSLAGRHHHAQTRRNYERMGEMLAERGIAFLVAQYPGVPIEPLVTVLGNVSNVAFVDNENVFLRAVRDRPADEIYMDLFGGIFGHLTAEGNRLLAENIADRILAMAEPDSSFAPTATRPVDEPPRH